ncbi:MAG: glycerol kinase GlpK [Clostridiales bacterium]|nr:glycerol kinase GlpK [Clostridiales bacterium]
MKKYMMAMDQGTTSSRCLIFDRGGNVISSAQKEFPQIYPRPGWVEHDPMEIWSTQIGVAQEALYKVNATFGDIEAIGIANQRETTVVWDKNTGMPVCNAVVWQCRRTAKACDELKEKGLSDKFREKTGLLIDAYFSATKIKWILDNVEGARQRAERGELLFGTIDTWLIWKLTGGDAHVTDYSNASRTMLFNIRELEWDREILDELGIPASMLPKVLPSSCLYGYTQPHIFGGRIKISGAAGDQQAALFGQACFKKGEAKNTYGTGCFLLMNTGDVPVDSKNGLLTTVAWGIGDQVDYALEGSVFIAGAAVQWLRDEMKLIKTAAESSEMAQMVDNNNGVYIVPAFVGLGAPYWQPYARGAITGLTRGANNFHVIRAALESIAYQTCDLIAAMEKDSGISLSSLKVDGGASENEFLMQFQADILMKPVRKPVSVETTAVGAAYLAGLEAGYWSSKDDITANWAQGRAYEPAMGREKRGELVAGWEKAVKSCMQWGK